MIKIDEYDAAIRQLERSIALKPDWPFAYSNLGYAYIKKSQWQAAIVQFNKAIEIFESKGQVYSRTNFGRATAYEAIGEVEKARLDYEVSCRFIKKGCEKLL